MVATIMCLPTNAGRRVDLVALLAAPHEWGVGSVLAEEGAKMITALLRARVVGHPVDRMVVCLASKLLGTGIEAVGDLGIRELVRTLIMADTPVNPCGADLILDDRVECPDNPVDDRRKETSDALRHRCVQPG